MKLSVVNPNESVDDVEIKFELRARSDNDLAVNVVFPDGTKNELGWFQEHEGKIDFELMFICTDELNVRKYFHMGKGDYDKEHEIRVIYYGDRLNV